ncbi:MAG TPA: hypothetical protein VFU89_06950 [Rhabdochlamydiaceae bacterium]|nr:hypothetical protein [Rhabdochlamydiaceae bacterium]
MFSGLSVIASRHLLNLSAYHYAPLWVPVVTQILYRCARYNVYRHFFTVDQFNTSLSRQRNDQHRLFLVLEGAQAITFFALAYLNHSYLIPACYTVAHLIWIHYSKINEKLEPNSSPPSFLSMDGSKRFKNAH